MLINNYVSSLTGEVCSEPVEVYTPEKCLSFNIKIVRNSGYSDIVEVITPDMYQHFEIGDSVRVVGFVYTYSNNESEYPKLRVCVYSSSIVHTAYSTNKNIIICCGVVVKIPKLRKTPSGIIICDVLVAVNNDLGQVSASYIPAVCWNGVAKQMSEISVGTPIYIMGKLQSREYHKTIGNENKVFTTRELSINTFSVMDSN